VKGGIGPLRAKGKSRRRKTNEIERAGASDTIPAPALFAIFSVDERLSVPPPPFLFSAKLPDLGESSLFFWRIFSLLFSGESPSLLFPEESFLILSFMRIL